MRGMKEMRCSQNDIEDVDVWIVRHKSCEKHAKLWGGILRAPGKIIR